jgi:hypothetical protein
MRDDAWSNLRKASQAVAILALAGVAFLFFLLWMSWHIVIVTIKYFVANLASQSGISTNLLYGIVIIATIPFFWAVAKYLQGIWSFLRGLASPLRLYKSSYGIIIVVYVGVFFIAMYFVSRESLAYKYCATTPEGIKAFDDRVKDPVYGIQAEPCTLDQIVEMRRTVHPELGPQRVQVSDARTFAFFEPATGHPRIWYHKSSAGEYEFFDRMGNDPATGEPLRVIDQQAREDAVRLQDQRASAPQQAEQLRLEQERLATKRQTEEQRMARIQADNERRASYLLVKSLPSRVEFVVSAETAAKMPMDSLAAAIAKKLKGKGKTASSFVFSSSFITSGAFDSFFDGRGGSDLQDMQVSAMGNNILLARITTNFVRPGASAVGLINASIVGSFRVISAHDGSVIDGFEIEAVGAGTSNDDAKSAALGHILEKLSQHGY